LVDDVRQAMETTALSRKESRITEPTATNAMKQK
jgi:hypothetical protein